MSKRALSIRDRLQRFSASVAVLAVCGLLVAATAAASAPSGGSGGFGPRLIGLGITKSPSFFAWRIKDPVAPMPKLYLTDQQIRDLAAYIETLGTTPASMGAPARSGGSRR